MEKIESSICIYMMTHGPECEIIPDGCVPLEIGSAVRNTFRYPLHDNTGPDNISLKDSLYCELTGLYWMWKNNTAEYTGLCHYRRVFRASKEKILHYLKTSDVIIPKFYHPGCSSTAHYAKTHEGEDWKIMLNVLKELYPEYADTAETVFAKHKFLPFNMFIASRDFLDAYCSWLFPLLFAIEPKLNIDGRSRYQARVVGYLSERLLLVYLVHNKLKMKHVRVVTTPQTPSEEVCKGADDKARVQLREYVMATANWMKYSEWKGNLKKKGLLQLKPAETESDFAKKSLSLYNFSKIGYYVFYKVYFGIIHP